MPLFENKFNPKKAANRRSLSMSNLSMDPTEKREEFGVDYGAVKIRLGSQEMKFDEGQWIVESGAGGASAKELNTVKKDNKRLTEENNLYKFKLELMLDMLSQKTAEYHLLENQLEQVKKQLKRR